ncbi:zinc finger BED domain-containing protein RICESLEEPER 2-like [Canna indica]|uniref:Zinc finger BED domain-containing protein RICESLEEPER 2-like n=1 Tax=Canna indica TaxID=4628 RepID=A0AAQ3L1A4_9LILI|nr:zinc finger BED domain-containing protein RICESLEEPER 2-like [Canna indica]
MAKEISTNVNIGVEVLENSNNFIESSGSGLGPAPKKRKAMKPRADVWNHYTKFSNKEGKLKCKCNYCEQEYACDTKQCGTCTLKAHLEKYFEYPPNKEKQQKKQTEIGYTPNLAESDPRSNIMSTWRFDQAATRKSLARMIVKNEYPFSCVDSEGLRDFCATGMPRFQIPSRQTVSRDCYELYVAERLNLKKLLQLECQHVCLTTDMWTSIQRINYMCIIAHFIDRKWKVQKKILNFCPISSHRGENIGKAIEKF